MILDALIVLLILGIAVYLFSTEKLPVDLVALMIMGTLLLSGIITPEEGIAGFSNIATVTVGAMFVISAALFKTGAIEFLGATLAKIGKINVWLALATMMLGIGAISAFINNTAAVAIFLPIVLGMARETKVSPSKFLMPLSFASMFGGVCTLIGTSTNILVSTIAKRYDYPPFHMFEFAPFGLILFAVGFTYMLLVGIRLIPNRRTSEDLTKNYGMGDYLTDIVLLPEAKSVGQTVRDSALVKELEVEIIDIFRNEKRLRHLSPWVVLMANDVLRVRCNVEKIKKLQERGGIVLKADKKFGDIELKSEDATLVEGVIAPRSVLDGKSLRQAWFRYYFDATVLAIRHHGQVMHENLEVTPLQSGDVLLMRVSVDQLRRLQEDSAFVIVSEVQLPIFRTRKILPAVAIITGVVASASLNLFPLVVSAIIGCVLLVLFECITLEEAYRAIDWRVIFLLAGVLTLGVALEKTGASQAISSVLVTTVGILGPVAVVSALYLLTSLLTETMSNNATAALLAPIAISAAQALEVDPRPFLMAVTFAASASFMTPVGYQTNTLIYGPGQYKFKDFIRVGTPLNLIFWLLATILIPRFWNF